MKPVVLSERLRAVVSMVTQGSRVCDVGCDHGFVSIYLIEQRISPHVVAMDVREGPLSSAGKHVAERALEPFIETRLSDGLHKYRIKEADSLVCAGMGGRLMMRILGEDRVKTDSFRELILQPQSELEQFRGWLWREGYRITDEKMVEEDGKFYPMMRVVTGDVLEDDGSSAGNPVLSERSGHTEGREWNFADVLKLSEDIKIEAEKLRTLFCRYGAYLLLRRDRTLQTYLEREERIYGEILDQLKRQEISSGKHKRRYDEVETLLKECRMAQEIMAAYKGEDS